MHQEDILAKVVTSCLSALSPWVCQLHPYFCKKGLSVIQLLRNCLGSKLLSKKQLVLKLLSSADYAISILPMSYIKGMLNNLDIQPGAVVNSGLSASSSSSFKLVHVPGRLHMAQMVCHSGAISPNDPLEEDDADNWLDKTMSFAIVLMNSQPSWASRLNMHTSQP